MEYVADAKHGFRAKIKSNEPGMQSRRSSADSPKFENVNLEETVFTENRYRNGKNTRAEVGGWPENVYLEVLQTPAQVSLSNEHIALGRTQSTNIGKHAEEEGPEYTPGLTIPQQSNQSRNIANRYSTFKNRPNRYQESASSSMMSRQSNEPSFSLDENRPQPANNSDTIIHMSDQSKQTIKNLLKPNRQHQTVESKRSDFVHSFANHGRQSNNGRFYLLPQKFSPTGQKAPVERLHNGRLNNRPNLPIISFGSKIEHQTLNRAMQNESDSIMNSPLTQVDFEEFIKKANFIPIQV